MIRITVKLGYFFHDHRSIARIIVNEKIKTIKDLEKRISHIFDIEDFYLKCDNHYLPSSETVDILSYDDIVWAVPYNLQNKAEVNISNGCDEPIKIKKTKKKSKLENDSKLIQTCDTSEIDNECTFQPDSKTRADAREKKKKKITIEEQNDQQEVTKKKKKSNKEVKEKSNNKESSSQNSSEKINGNCEMKSVKSIVNSFESGQLYSKKHFTTPQIKEYDKKINIVKTIIISNGNNNNTPKSQTDESPNKEILNGIIEESSLERNTLNSSDLGYSSPTASKDNSLIVTQKKSRKRVRKRKHNKKDKTEVTGEVKSNTYQLIPRPLLHNKPDMNKHLRFETVEPECIDISVDNDSEDVINIETGFEHVQNENFEPSDLTEDFIMKQPITTNIQPREGDIIAFKILRISNNYTPELSSSIVGKVLSYNTDSKAIEFNVVYGADQCLQPTGKFSLDLENDEEVNNITQQKFIWSDLIEPRALYP